MTQEHVPPDFQAPAPPSRHLGDLDLPTFFWLLFFVVALAVTAGLALFYWLVHLFNVSLQ